MDDKTLKSQKERLAALDKQLADLTVKLRTVEARLANEQDLIRKAAAQRAGIVSQLVDAPEETARKLHRQLDGLDAQITASERMSESYQRLLVATKQETEQVTAERTRVNEIVAAENNSREFQAWTVTMQQNFEAATAAMENARTTLGRLTVEAARGAERFKGAASTWAGSRFEEFEHRQGNPDSLLGFRMATPWYRNIRISIFPMVKG